MNTDNLKRAYSTSEAAHYCGVSESFLRQSRMTSPTARKIDSPIFVKIGVKKVIYRIEDLDAWLDSRDSMRTKTNFNINSYGTRNNHGSCQHINMEDNNVQK